VVNKWSYACALRGHMRNIKTMGLLVGSWELVAPTVLSDAAVRLTTR